MNHTPALFVSVPIASFRVPRAREYFESLPCPPPATVYGMLLSLVGEYERRTHEGVELALATLSQPSWSTVVRKLWRVKKAELGPGRGENARPDFQEILCDVRLAIWIRHGREPANQPGLADRVRVALEAPHVILRHGALCLGESTHLVDEIRPLRPEQDPSCGRILVHAQEGSLSLPIWPDHVGSRTTWGQFELRNWTLSDGVPEEAWTTIQRQARLRG